VDVGPVLISPLFPPSFPNCLYFVPPNLCTCSAAKPKPCLGGAQCLFGGKHPEKAENGKAEYVLGCGVCRPKPEDEAGEAEELDGGVDQ